MEPMPAHRYHTTASLCEFADTRPAGLAGRRRWTICGVLLEAPALPLPALIKQSKIQPTTPVHIFANPEALFARRPHELEAVGDRVGRGLRVFWLPRPGARYS